MMRKMLCRSAAVVSLLFAICGAARAQLRVENDPNSEVPQLRAQLILSVTCSELGKDIREKDLEACDFPVTLVMATRNERIEEDEPANTYKIFMDTWDEGKFTLGAMRLSILRLLGHKRRVELRTKVMARVDMLAPVSVGQLQQAKAGAKAK